jgi:hypothetical protein
MTDDERSSEARALAERALGRLLSAGAPTSEQLIVLGGLVPPTLARTGAPGVPAHLGTTDVDVLLVTHLTVNRDLGPIERALEALQFTPHAEGWRWSGRIEDRLVKIAGYLLSKAASVRTRGADKDYYDFAHVLLHNNAGGPVAAANTTKASPLADALPSMGSTFVELRERFRNDRAHGARIYAREARKVTPEDDELILAADAAAAVNEVLDILSDI